MARRARSKASISDLAIRCRFRPNMGMVLPNSMSLCARRFRKQRNCRPRRTKTRRARGFGRMKTARELDVHEAARVSRSSAGPMLANRPPQSDSGRGPAAHRPGAGPHARHDRRRFRVARPQDQNVRHGGLAQARPSRGQARKARRGGCACAPRNSPRSWCCCSMRRFPSRSRI